MILLYGTRLDFNLPWNVNLDYDENIRLQKSWFLQHNLDSIIVPKSLEVLKIVGVDGILEWYLAFYSLNQQVLTLDFDLILKVLKDFETKREEWIQTLENFDVTFYEPTWIVKEGIHIDFVNII